MVGTIAIAIAITNHFQNIGIPMFGIQALTELSYGALGTKIREKNTLRDY